MEATPATETENAGSPVTPGWKELAPRYVERVSPWLCVAVAALLLVSPLPAYLQVPGGSWITFGGPFLLFALVMARSNQVVDRTKREYAKQLLAEAGLDPEDESLSTEAEAVFSKKSEISNIQGVLCVAFIAYLFVWYTVLVFDGNAWDFTTPAGWVSIAGDALTWIIAGFAALVYGVTFVGTHRFYSFNIADLRPSISGLFSLRPEDRNDIDIAGLGVALQALMRRAEAYTIESTLLSALSFSAFVGIAFSDIGPIESSSWLKGAFAHPDCSPTTFAAASSCLVRVSQESSGHIMYMVSATLLLTSVLFLAALVIRFRFNEAYKYAEEILCIAKILNDKESETPESDRGVITREIDKTLGRAQLGLDDLRPLGNAMKNFRNAGILFFVVSITLCGLYFHWVASVVLCGVVLSAYVVTYVDHFRRNTTFLPKLESLAMSIWHQRI